MKMRNDPYQIIIKPIITEKSMGIKETSNVVTFEVHPKANKSEIKKAVEQLFGVKVLSVNTMNVKGKTKRFRFVQGKKKDWKKAMVKLKPGDTIDLFEGV